MDAGSVEKSESWDSLSIPLQVLRGVHSYGFEKPSPIQCQAIKPIVDGGDVIAQAQSGTGKTGAFTIGLLSRLDFNVKGIQVVSYLQHENCLNKLKMLLIVLVHFVKALKRNCL